MGTLLAKGAGDVRGVEFAPDSPLEETVTSELVSGNRKFPASSVLTGIFRRMGLRGAKKAPE